MSYNLMVKIIVTIISVALLVLSSLKVVSASWATQLIVTISLLGIVFQKK